MNIDEELIEKSKVGDNCDVPVIPYTEWINYFNEIMNNIRNDVKNFPYRRVCSNLLFIEAVDVPKEQEDKYAECQTFLRNFNSAYDYKSKYDHLYGRETSALEIYNSIMNGTAQYEDQNGYANLV